MSCILKYLSTFIFSLLFVTSVFSQERYMVAYEKEGDIAMNYGEYETALDHYNTSRKFFQTPLRIYYKMGEACRMLKDYDKAEYYYQKVITENDSLKDRKSVV